MTKNNQLDKSIYENSKMYLKAALEQMIAAGRSAREFGDVALEKFGETVTPYLHEFSKDVSKGRIKIEGLGKSAKRTILGSHVSPEERQQMIREAAYLRAERRGFVGGSAEDDWHMATQEIDQRLAQETGLVDKGHKALSSAGTIIEHEIDDIKHVVASWFEGKLSAVEKKVVAKKKKSAAKKSPIAEQEKVAKQPLDKTEEKALKETAKVKPAAKKKASTKKAAKKE